MEIKVPDINVDVKEDEQVVDSFNLKDLIQSIVDFILKILKFEFDM